MKDKKKYSTALIIAAVLCLIGCTLIVLQKFIESEMNLFMIGIAINGIGIMIFLFGIKSGQESK